MFVSPFLAVDFTCGEALFYVANALPGSIGGRRQSYRLPRTSQSATIQKKTDCALAFSDNHIFIEPFYQQFQLRWLYGCSQPDEQCLHTHAGNDGWPRGHARIGSEVEAQRQYFLMKSR